MAVKKPTHAKRKAGSERSARAKQKAEPKKKIASGGTVTEGTPHFYKRQAAERPKWLTHAKRKAGSEQSARPKRKTQQKNKTASGRRVTGRKRENFRKQLEKKFEVKKVKPERPTGVVFVSNVPYGFTKDVMEQYFSQFGEILRVSPIHSRKTGNYRGYTYIEFAYKEVARIVAYSMDSYLMFKKMLKCSYVPDSKRNDRKMFPEIEITPYNCPGLHKRMKAVRQLNRTRSQGMKQKKMVTKLKKSYNAKLKKLKGLGINLNLRFTKRPPKKKKTKSSALEEKTVDVDEAADSEEDSENPLPEVEGENVEDLEGNPTEYSEEEKLAMEKCMADLAEKINANLSKKLLKKSVSKVSSTEEDESNSCKESSESMIVEVDESEDEIQLKTPPNFVKKFVKINSSSPALKRASDLTPKVSSKKQKISDLVSASLETPKVTRSKGNTQNDGIIVSDLQEKKGNTDEAEDISKSTKNSSVDLAPTPNASSRNKKNRKKNRKKIGKPKENLKSIDVTPTTNSSSRNKKNIKKNVKKIGKPKENLKSVDVTPTPNANIRNKKNKKKVRKPKANKNIKKKT